MAARIMAPRYPGDQSSLPRGVIAVARPVTDTLTSGASVTGQVLAWTSFLVPRRPA